VRIAELLAVRQPFKKKCWQVTIVDTAALIPEGELFNYKIDGFRRILDQAARKSGHDIRALGQFEFKLVSQLQNVWSPHIHMIVSGRKSRTFIRDLRELFRPRVRNQKPVKVQRLNTRNDVLRAATYQFKSSTARRKYSVPLSAEQILELNEFLLEKSCSDLLWIKGMNFRDARVRLSTERELDVWHLHCGHNFFFEKNYERRVVPKIPYALRRSLFGGDGEVRPDRLREEIQMITEYFRTKP
tara:strand:- start:2729 stop:3457 length:729 start_codon:yes stop_codon:yes gene_type:complete